MTIHPNFVKRLLAAMLAVIMAMSLCVTALAAEPDSGDSRPDLEAIAALFINWNGDYELPDLGELSPEDQETVKNLVNAAMLAREAGI